ncbi:hypothetical protein BCEP4_100024 [Burkholderia cepacia]|nr:hypothetical protein BCEP4_100024 [Burkholderia cepacia]
MIFKTAIRLQTAYANVNAGALKWFADCAALPEMHKSVSRSAERGVPQTAKIRRLPMLCRR